MGVGVGGKFDMTDHYTVHEAQACQVSGQDPATLPFDQGAMRKHLRPCLQRQQMDPFPALKEIMYKNRALVSEVERSTVSTGGSDSLEKMYVPM